VTKGFVEVIITDKAGVQRQRHFKQIINLFLLRFL